MGSDPVSCEHSGLPAKAYLCSGDPKPVISGNHYEFIGRCDNSQFEYSPPLFFSEIHIINALKILYLFSLNRAIGNSVLKKRPIWAVRRSEVALASLQGAVGLRGSPLSASIPVLPFPKTDSVGSFAHESSAPEGSPFWLLIDTSVYSGKLLKRGKHENTVLNVETFIFISLRGHELNANYKSERK